MSLPIWINFMSEALRGVPVEQPSPPEGVVSLGGDWYFQEYTPGHSVGKLGATEGMVGDLPAAAPAIESQEKRSILDLFRN